MVGSETRPVLVTGAQGFVGRQVVSELLERGSQVVEIPHRWASRDHLDALIGATAVGSCIHLGWYAAPHDYLVNGRENLESLRSSLELISWLTDHDVGHLVVSGSCAEYGQSTTPHVEDELPAPSSVYGTTKASLWRCLQDGLRPAGLGIAWARVFNVTGPGEHPDRIFPTVIRSLMAGLPFDLTSGEQRRDYLDVADVARALVALSADAVDDTVNVCSGQPVELRALLLTIGEQLGRPELLRFGTRPRGSGDADAVLGSNERLRSITGWTRLHDTDAMISRLIDDLSAEPKDLHS